jgi:hypothetical protein
MTSALDAPSVVLPRVSIIPPSSSNAASDVLGLADACGLGLLPWQRWALTASLGERADGTWAAGEVAWLLPRQNGKTYAIAARILGGLYVLDEELIVFTAHEFKTAIEVFRTVDKAARSFGPTERLIKSTRWSHGEETIELHTGQRFKILARTRASGRGFSGDCVILDEALELRDDAAMAALMPTLSARANPQLWYVSSAGDPGSTVLAEVRARALGDDADGLCYLEWSAAPDDSLDDPAVWASANPGHPYLIKSPAIARERRALTPERFRQERLGVWAGETRRAVIPAMTWAATTLDVQRWPEPGSCALAFDVSLDREWSSIVVGWLVDGVPHVRISRHDKGDGWLVEELARLSATLGVPVVGDDVGPARYVLDQLDRARVPIRTFTLREFTTACSAFLSALVNRAATHHPDDAMDEAAAAAATRRVGEAWAWNRRDSDDVPISPLVAATLAFWAVAHEEPRPEPPAIW